MTGRVMGQTLAEVRDVLRAHLPRDRYVADGITTGTCCTCGEWEGDYFADGDAGPFDDHLAGAIVAWLRTDAGQEAAQAAVNGPRSDEQGSAGVVGRSDKRKGR